MCGIIGYTGKQHALPILLEGLRSMEYRGYDSSGVAVVSKDGNIFCAKEVGRLENLKNTLKHTGINASTIGIGHNRWATHGGVSKQNAHPHSDCAEKIFVVHNGIIENYMDLKEELGAEGHVFRSDTDTEVITHLIERYMARGIDMEHAVQEAIGRLRGTYGLAIINAYEPDMLIAVRNESPLIVGLDGEDRFIASDAAAILAEGRTIECVYLDNGQIAVLTPGHHRITNISGDTLEKSAHRIEWSVERARKDGYPHFMLKEIFTQPQAIRDSMRGRLLSGEGKARLGGLNVVINRETGETALDRLDKAGRIIITACGTAMFAGEGASILLEEFARIPTKVQLASELRHRKTVYLPNDVLLAFSQSGETADTLAAIRAAKDAGVLTLGIVNVVGSSIARETDAGVYQHIGPEIGVASTKAFTSQYTIAVLLATLLGQRRGVFAFGEVMTLAAALDRIPDQVQSILDRSEEIMSIAEHYAGLKNFYFLSRTYNVPVAFEGALKLKEISYWHAEGCGAGEMKHGGIAMIDEEFLSVCIIPDDPVVYEKMFSNVKEIKARNGPILAIATEGDMKVQHIADHVIYVPRTHPALYPLLTVIPLQLIAYRIGVILGHDVDHPRNLAKSVTVE